MDATGMSNNYQNEENNIPIDYICGTSMGALVACMYAQGMTPVEMEKLVQEGLVKNLGVCNFNAQALGMLLPHCIQFSPMVNQVERHPLCQQWELVDFCFKNDILLQAHTPLGQGKSNLLQHDIVKKIAMQNNQSPAQVVLQWNLQQGVAVVPKCSIQEHHEAVLALTDTKQQ